PTPLANGVTTRLSGLMSLSGVPKKPQTMPGAFVPGSAGAWIWAAIRLSLMSAVWVPVTSMLNIVAVKDSASSHRLARKWQCQTTLGEALPLTLSGYGEGVDPLHPT